ncbi:class I SAM-dependent methyltransferase [Shinella oryzae]|uniref:Class I SAM-dependent methyltransferase n=1 Tax=Shinella oryzae TaxID=2871820 RepID=A0ABY9K8M4_9HYPH|nr:class I SAM-dependent methyltransferase [Shinella oryzae]WLS04930.1 class I SAM-dependent methyltransferase [Shinella oryzae]
MVDPQIIERWRTAPRLTSFAPFFEQTASGQGGAPDIGKPAPDISLHDFDLDCAVYADTHFRLFGPFDSHYHASIPYRLEETCRLGPAILSVCLRRWAKTAQASTLYTLGAGTGCMARSVAVLGDGRVKTLACSPTPANRAAFFAKRGSEHAHFFLGPFFELDAARYATDPDLAHFRNGFDVLVEDTTFQMYDRDRAAQLSFITPRLRRGGLLVQVQKLAHEDHDVYAERENQKDGLFKSRFFSDGQISEKKAEILETMANCQVDLQTTVAALRLFFRYSVLTWNSGNFYTIVSSNSRASILEFVSLMVKPAIPPAFCYETLPAVIIDTPSEPLGPALSWRRANGRAAMAAGRAEEP